MTSEDKQQFIGLGYQAAERVARSINAGNANECAAAIVSRELEYGLRGAGSSQTISPAIVLRLQRRCGTDLSPLLLLDDEEQLAAAALLVAGCMKFLHDNPD